MHLRPSSGSIVELIQMLINTKLLFIRALESVLQNFICNRLPILITLNLMTCNKQTIIIAFKNDLQLNLLYWFDFKLEPIFVTAPIASKFDAQ